MNETMDIPTTHQHTLTLHLAHSYHSRNRAAKPKGGNRRLFQLFHFVRMNACGWFESLSPDRVHDIDCGCDDCHRDRVNFEDVQQHLYADYTTLYPDVGEVPYTHKEMRKVVRAATATTRLDSHARSSPHTHEPDLADVEGQFWRRSQTRHSWRSAIGTNRILQARPLNKIARYLKTCSNKCVASINDDRNCSRHDGMKRERHTR